MSPPSAKKKKTFQKKNLRKFFEKNSPCEKLIKPLCKKKKTQPLAKKSKNKQPKKNFEEKNNSCKQENKTHCENKDAKKRKIHLLEKNFPFSETNFFFKKKQFFV